MRETPLVTRVERGVVTRTRPLLKTSAAARASHAHALFTGLAFAQLTDRKVTEMRSSSASLTTAWRKSYLRSKK